MGSVHTGGFFVFAYLTSISRQVPLIELLDQEIEEDPELRDDEPPGWIDRVKVRLHGRPIVEGSLKEPFFQIFLNIGARNEAQAETCAQRVPDGKTRCHLVAPVDGDPHLTVALAKLPCAGMT